MRDRPQNRNSVMTYPILYVSPEEADAYLSDRGTAWSALGNPEKLHAIGRAGQMLDDLFRWKGEPVSPEQTLRWPRRNAVDAEGNLLSETVIPEAIKRAVCEQAFYLIDPLRKISRRIGKSGVKSITLGSISMSVDSGKEEEPLLSPLAVNAANGLGSLRSGSAGSNRSAAASGNLLRG